MDRYLKLCDHFVFKGHICIVFELFSVSLHKVLRQSPRLSILDIKKIASRILETLDLLKHLHIVHTDLKPDNILLKSSEDLHDVKLIDYGSASIENEVPLSYHIQTAFYRSPEVILKIPYNCAIDMWSFGCFVAEMFIGKPLFPSGNEIFLLHMMAATLKSLPPDTMLKRGERSSEFFHMKGLQNGVDVTKLRDKITHDFSSLDERVMGSESEDSEQDRHCLLDFLKRILVYDPDKRYTPREALNHPFVADAREDIISRSTEESHEIKTPSMNESKFVPTKPLKSILKKSSTLDLNPPLENTLNTAGYLYQPRPSMLHPNGYPPVRMYPQYYSQYQLNQTSHYFSH